MEDSNELNKEWNEKYARDVYIRPTSKNVETRPVGRPSDYTKELGDEICNLLSEGISLRTVCLREDMPNKATVFRWFREHKEFCDQYARAKEESADADAEVLEEIGDKAIKHAEEADPKASNAVVSAYKLKADNLKWAMSKKKPKKYGDKIDVTSDGKALPTPILGAITIKNEVPTDNNITKDISTEEAS